MRRSLRAAIVLVVTAVVAVSAVVVGNAAQLPVDAGQISVATANHPCSGRTLAVTAAPVAGTTSTVSVTMPADWPTACVGKRVDVVVADAAVTRTGSITSAPAAGSSASVTLSGAFTPAATGITTAAVVAGWSLATSWSYTPPGNPLGTCVIVNPAGNPIAGQTCTVTSLQMGTYWGTAGSRMANYYVGFSSTNVNGNQRVRFSLNLQNAQGVPAGWNWATSGSLSGGNITTLSGYACSELPVLRGQTPPGWGSYPSVFFQITENRATASNLSCS